VKRAIHTINQLMHNRIPGQLVIQVTDQCNATCPQCGMRVTETFTRHTLKTDDIKRIIDAAAAKSFQAVSFTGGETLLHPRELAHLISYAGRAGIPYIRTGTNGFLFQRPEKPGFTKRVSALVEMLAATPLRNFWISIDSHIDHLHEQMRGLQNVMAGIEKALPIFHAAGLYPSANLGVNRNVGGRLTQTLFPAKGSSEPSYLDLFESAFFSALCRFYRKVIDMGFTMVNTCYPMSIDQDEKEHHLEAVYPASSVDRIVRFTPAEKARLFAALLRAVDVYRSRIRIFSPLSSLHALMLSHRNVKQNSGAAFACRGGIDFFFINCRDGAAYPCGYRGQENMGPFWDLDLSTLPHNPHQAHCTLCDWECFRDPSELLGPLMEMMRLPVSAVKRCHKNGKDFKRWLQDITYYQACDFFDGRKPLNRRKVGTWKRIARLLK